MLPSYCANNTSLLSTGLVTLASSALTGLVVSFCVAVDVLPDDDGLSSRAIRVLPPPLLGVTAGLLVSREESKFWEICTLGLCVAASTLVTDFLAYPRPNSDRRSTLSSISRVTIGTVGPVTLPVILQYGLSLPLWTDSSCPASFTEISVINQTSDAAEVCRLKKKAVKDDSDENNGTKPTNSKIPTNPTNVETREVSQSQKNPEKKAVRNNTEAAAVDLPKGPPPEASSARTVAK